MKNKFTKKLRTLLTGLMAVLLMFGGMPVKAAGNTLADVGINIENVDLIELALNSDTAITSENVIQSSSDTSGYDVLDGSRAEVNDIHSITYTNGLDYFGKKITVVVKGQVTSYGEDVTEEDGVKIYTAPDAKGNKKILNRNKGAKDTYIQWTIELLDNGTPFSANNLLVGLIDPDEAHYYFETANTEIYYRDADAYNEGTASRFGAKVSDAFHLEENGLILRHLDGSLPDGSYAANYNNGGVFIKMDNQNSFTITAHNIAGPGGAVYPYFYALKTPQKATVKIVDENTNETLKTSDTLEGLTDDEIVYNVDENIKDYLDNGYELVSEDVSGKKFDADEDTNQEFTVVLKHKTTTITPETEVGTPVNPNEEGTKVPELELTKTVKRTIKYQYDDGSKAGEDVVEEVKMTRNAIVDNVTGEVVEYGEWVPEKTNYEEVESSKIAGYTADKEKVEGTEVKPEDETVVVTYNPNEQKAIVRFVDVNGKKIADNKSLIGKSNQPIAKDTVDGDINKLLNDGYSLISNELYDGVSFDAKDEEDQILTVVVKEKLYTVTFLDSFGGVVDTQPGIRHHGSATTPTDPTHEGYVFTGWDVAYDDITSNLNVHALWREVDITELFTVTFVDGQGNTLKVQPDVMLHGSVLAPEDPTREGYTFIGWDVQFDDIIQDTTVTAQWMKNDPKKVNVIFQDGFGVNIDAQQIDKGTDAKAPANPTKDGYKFLGWDIEFTNVQEDIIVNALWEPQTFTVTFVDGLGNTLSVVGDVPMHGAAEAPQSPTREGYKFVGWDALYNNVTKDMTVTALWEKVELNAKGRKVVDTGAGVPLVAGIVFLGVLAGGFYFLKKKENKE